MTQPMGTLFFDFDGTINDSMRIYGPAFREAVRQLEEDGHLQHREYTDKEISHWLGYTVQEMWTTFAPHLDEEVWRPASKVIGAEMRRLEQTGAGSMFPQTDKALQQLKDEGWTMVVLSNCARSYCDFYRELYGLDNWFSDYLCAGDFDGLSKAEIYLQEQDKRDFPFPHIMIGDRHHDMAVARQGGIPFVGCGYGYAETGELDDADAIIDSVCDLPAAVRGLV